MTRNPTPAEIINDAIDGALAGLYMHLPGRVVRYDEAIQAADVQPIGRVRYQDEDGNQITETLPVLTDVPVIFPGGGGYTVTFPVAVGDEVWLEFSATSLDKWKRSLSSGTIDPINHSRHSIADAIATPGLRSLKRARKNMPTDHVLIGSDGGTAHGAALGDNLKTYVLGIDGSGASLTCLQGFCAAVATALTGLGVPTSGPSSPTKLVSATVKVTE